MSLFSLSSLTAVAELLTMSLMHFVWQGIGLALMLLIVVKLGNVRSAQHRYLLSVGTLVMMGIAPVLTAILFQPLHSQRHAISMTVSPMLDLETPADPSVGTTTTFDVVIPAEQVRANSASKVGLEVYVLIAWLMGVCVLSLRLAIGFGIGLWIRAKIQPLSAEFEQRVQALGERLAVNVQSRVFACARVGQAVAIGFLRPVVLIPTSWLTQLAPQTIEAIIAHELAHIRRWDLWINLVQRIIETLLFYHPAVWWLSDRIRLEREMCCDEIAAACFDPATYARSLASVATISNHNLLLATSIGGGRKMKLLNRIGYLLGITPANTVGSWWTFGLVAVVLPFAALASFCYSVAAKPPAGPSKDLAGTKAVDAVVTTRLQPQTVTLVEQYVGTINSHHRIEIRAMAKGYIDELSVKEGQRVKAGDLIFRVRPVMYQAKLDAESADAKFVQLEYNYTKKLHENKVVSADELALQEAKLSKAMAKVNIAVAELEFTTAKAPFDGIIDRLERQQGSSVLEGDTVTTLSDNSTVGVYFEIPETRYFEFIADSPRKEDLQVQLTLANGTVFDQPGRINSIEADFNSETGTIGFRADFPNPLGIVRHGQRGTVKISRQLKNAIVVPQQATFEMLDKRFVYSVDKDQIAHLREITVQQELNDSFIIKTGLSGDEQIVIEGLRQIVDGGKVPGEDDVK
jgi:membrane fusion protein (multidrug efflux system)